MAIAPVIQAPGRGPCPRRRVIQFCAGESECLRVLAAGSEDFSVRQQRGRKQSPRLHAPRSRERSVRRVVQLCAVETSRGTAATREENVAVRQ
jgi:hypothetical protein